MKITEEYRKLNERFHREREDYGISGAQHAKTVAEIAMMIQADTILDYGCGKQTLARALPQFVVKGYDPAVPGMDAPPEPADLVVCTDVLEHVEPECLEDVLKDLHALTEKVLYLSISTRPAKKTLPDGRNAHINLMHYRDWLAKLLKYFELDHFTNVGNQQIMAILTRRER